MPPLTLKFAQYFNTVAAPSERQVAYSSLSAATPPLLNPNFTGEL